MTKDKNLHDDGDSTDDNQHQRQRVEPCNIDDIQNETLRELAEDWKDEGRRLEAGCQLGQLDFVFDMATGVSLYETEMGYVADDGRDKFARFEEPRDAAQVAIRYLDDRKREKFPDGINEFFDDLDDFEVTRGGTDEGTPAITGERDSTSIAISWTIDDQWWLVGESDGVRPITTMYEEPERVVIAATEWLDAVED